MRDFLRQFMLYSRGERRAVVALTVLIVVVIAIPKVYYFYCVPAQAIYRDSTLARQLSFAASDSFGRTIETKEDAANQGPLFDFDPNTISTNEWLRLGISDKQAAVIEKYVSKGGKFRRPEDLRKIYVLNDEEKDRLLPYVKIRYNPGPEPSKTRSPYIIEINTADSAAYEALYGIGPALSARIIKFRNLLGGFYSIDQVGETYGVSDSTFQMIKPHLTVNATLVKRIDLNTASYDDLSKHPYIHAKIAHTIVDYRNRNGKFENIEQFKALKPVGQIIFEKIKPYLIIGR